MGEIYIINRMKAVRLSHAVLHTAYLTDVTTSMISCDSQTYTQHEVILRNYVTYYAGMYLGRPLGGLRM